MSAEMVRIVSRSRLSPVARSCLVHYYTNLLTTAS